MTIRNVLSIAGSDPSGGAGIQADLKTFSALGAYGMAVITAVTAQATTGVTGIERVSPAMVSAQIDTLLADVRIDAVKIGMVVDAEIVAAVAAGLRRWRPPVVVVDPVMVATSGDRLLAPDAVAAMTDELLPLVDLVTPNLAEAAVLAGSTGDPDELAVLLAERLGTRVLVKGGHGDGPESVDVLAGDGDVDGGLQRFVARRVPTTSTHGTGCTLSAAIAALRPDSASWPEAIGAAKSYLTQALRAADRLDVGHGTGPVHHVWGAWPAG